MSVDVVPLPGAGPCHLGESPVWDADAGQLVWVDILEGAIHRCSIATGQTHVVRLEQSVGAVALGARGTLVAAVADGFSVVEPDRPARTVTSFLRDEDLRMNEGKCDPAGRFLAGTTSLSGRASTSALYRLEDDGSVTMLLGGVSVSNGLAWSADGGGLSFIDTPTRAVAVHAYDPDASALERPRRRIDLAHLAGAPDGMAIDVEENLWIAFWGGGCVCCVTPDGEVVEVIELPVANVTSCAFGGHDLSTLFITTARLGRSERQLDEEPLAGHVFSCRPGVAGAPASRWRGLDSGADAGAAA